MDVPIQPGHLVEFRIRLWEDYPREQWGNVCAYRVVEVGREDNLVEMKRKSVKICIFGDLIADYFERWRTGERKEVVHGVDQGRLRGIA